MKTRVFIVLALFCSAMAFGQGAIRLPEASQEAHVGQTIGVTDIHISYHRPAVNGRRIWGGLVPYGVIWRAGANECTTISFSTPVKVEGHDLAAGNYALFLIPGQSQWTVVLNKFTGGWGTYSYDQSEDALRVTVTPQSAEMAERLLFTFDDPAASAVVAAMRWEKLRVPFKIEVDLPVTVRASIRDTLRGGKHWDNNALAAAARWELRQNNLEAALDLANRSLDYGINSGNLRTKAAILEKKGDAKGAAELRERAKSLANEGEMIGQAYNLIGQKKYDEALTYMNTFTTTHPANWRSYAALGDIYAAKGDHAKANEMFDKAMGLAHDQSERVEVQDSINAMGAETK
jgi:tetratricopeptide (TPR) repeat protein